MIFTFYSFKGGVGRSMAMASIAELLFKRGLRVRIVDFDLEAPGLERYFDHADVVTPLAKIQENRGVIDMLESYCQLTDLPSDLPQPREHGSDEARIEALLTEPLDRFLVPIYTKRDSYLSILPAGRRAGGEFKDYASRVLSFDWNTFFGRLDGELFFEWFRREIVKNADVVLVDSRTGVTEMTGVSTFHLADVVVSVVAPNHQNLEGLVQMAQRLSSDAVKKARRDREVLQMFVPSRVSLDDESQLNRFKTSYDKALGPFFPDVLRFDGQTFHALKILHVPTFSYTERVAGREQGSAIEADLVRAYETIARHMARLAQPAHALYASFHSVAEVKARKAAELYEGMLADQRRLFWQLATRLVRVGAEGERTVARQVTLSQTDITAFTEVLSAAVAQEILHTEVVNGVARVSWIDEQTPDNWTQLQTWVASDLPFLSWRQSLDERLATWQTDEREANLLIGTPLRAGVDALQQRHGDLLPSEQAFIERSVEAEEARLAADPAARVRELEASRLDVDSYITEQYTVASGSTNRARIAVAFVYVALVAAWIGIIEPTVAHTRVRMLEAPKVAEFQRARTNLESLEAAKSSGPPTSRVRRRQPTARKIRNSIDWMRAAEAEYVQVPIGRFPWSAANAVAMATGIGSITAWALLAFLLMDRSHLTRTLQPAFDRLSASAMDNNDPLVQKWKPRLERVTDTLGRPVFDRGHAVLAGSALVVLALIFFRISFLGLALWSYSWPYKILLVWIAVQALAAIGAFVLSIRDDRMKPREPQPATAVP